MKISLDEAIQRVLEAGEKSHCEHCMLLSPEFEFKFWKDGEKSSIDFSLEMLSDIFQAGDILIHNHPIVASLSLQDIDFATRFGGIIYAATPDGSRFWSTGFKRHVLFHEAFTSLQAAIVREFQLRITFNGGEYSEDEFHAAAFTHFRNLELQRLGLIDYDFHLKGLSKEAAVWLAQGAARVNRHGIWRI